jgi:Fungal Zn(2)-Cys(6) binuclear cluster domain
MPPLARGEACRDSSFPDLTCTVKRHFHYNLKCCSLWIGSPSLDALPWLGIMSTLLRAVPPGGGVPTSSLAAPGQLPPKRNRTQLSCTHCRHAKLKCDRNLPCLPCIKRGRAVQCTFPAPATRKKPTESMQSRLRHLESLVKDAMNSQTPASNGNVPESARLNGVVNNDVGVESKPNPGDQTQATSEMQIPFGPTQKARTKAIDAGSSGQVIQSIKETTYVGATHWAAILEDVSLCRTLSRDPLLIYATRSKRSKATLMKQNPRIALLTME